MQTTSHDNQLLMPSQVDSRILDLRVWMVRKGVNFSTIAQALGGITRNAVRQMLTAERISTVRHQELTAFGIPGHLLPPAQDVRLGRPSVKK